MNVKIIKWLRALHRDLGFLMVGVSLIYGISGMILNHMGDSDPAFNTIEETLQLKPNIEISQLETFCTENHLPKLKRTLVLDKEHTQLMFEGGIGVYNHSNGVLDYELHSKNEFIFWINRLHYNRINGWHWIADLFAFSLIFLAISGLFIVKGKKGIGGRGKWILLVGFIIPVVYIILQ